jgi:hypothetical protein
VEPGPVRRQAQRQKPMQRIGAPPPLRAEKLKLSAAALAAQA